MKAYLPIGTIVLLNEGTKKLMIYGRKQTSLKTGKEYDYLGCLYPEGNINEAYTFLFDIEDIAQVVFRGYSDAEDEDFINTLNKL